jgi:hypothetical protein
MRPGYDIPGQPKFDVACGIAEQRCAASKLFTGRGEGWGCDAYRTYRVATRE